MTTIAKRILALLSGKHEKFGVTVVISDKGVVSVDPASVLHATVAKKHLQAAKRLEEERRVATGLNGH